jgi:bifunctional ADP-heptose synthase (sugar kinase/adenylyltransferase)
LNRLDSKNWTETPADVSKQIAANVEAVSSRIDALIVLDQVDLPGTGVVTRDVLNSIGGIGSDILTIADSRQGLSEFPPLIFKMNKAELAKLSGAKASSMSAVEDQALAVAAKNQRPVFVSLAEEGILGADPLGKVEHVPALPLRGDIDIVGAGDAVTANLTCALAAGATIREALELANASASVVIHQLGTTGTADISQLRATLLKNDS